MATWTEEQKSELKRLWATKANAREIGGILGFGRNAIIGQSNRMGLPMKRSKGKPVDKTKSPPVRKPIRVARYMESPPPPPQTCSAPPEMIAGGIPIGKLQKASCRAIITAVTHPIEDVRYCGAPKSGDTSWCAFHRAIYCQPLRR